MIGRRRLVYGQTYLDLQTTPPAVAWQMLRTLRSSPPGNAQRGDRRQTFNAALEQAEQLFGAAANVGPAARPLLAFYGLSQAGRAVAAAALDVSNREYRLGGHGITTGQMQGLAASGLAALTVEDQGEGSLPNLRAFSMQPRCQRQHHLANYGDCFPTLAVSHYPTRGVSVRSRSGSLARRSGFTTYPLPCSAFQQIWRTPGANLMRTQALPQSVSVVDRLGVHNPRDEPDWPEAWRRHGRSAHHFAQPKLCRDR